MTDRTDIDAAPDSVADTASDGARLPVRRSDVAPRALPRDGHPATPTTMVRLRGELDVMSEPDVWALLNPLSGKPGADVIIDLREVTFLDCRGVSPLCRARGRLRAAGGRMRLIVGSPGVERLLRLTRLDRSFDIVHE
jgi:anti-sigma B factor antagonist